MKHRYANLFYEYQYYAYAHIAERYNLLVMQYNWLVDENRRLSEEIRRLEARLSERTIERNPEQMNHPHESTTNIQGFTGYCLHEGDSQSAIFRRDEVSYENSSVHQNQMEVIREFTDNLQYKKPIQMSFDE